jgi:hypothetical protein
MAIREKYGPRAIASFCGTAGYSNSATIAVVKAWHRAVGSINNFSTMTVDQWAKVVVPGRVGAWGGGWHTFASADVARPRPATGLWRDAKLHAGR